MILCSCLNESSYTMADSSLEAITFDELKEEARNVTAERTGGIVSTAMQKHS